MTIPFRSATEAGTGSASASLVINVPAGVQDGDILILFGVTADGDDGGFDALTGWTQLVNNLNVPNAPSPPGITAWRRVASSEPASYTITPAFGNTGISAQMQAFSGVDNTTPIDVTTTTSTGDGANADPTSITPITDGALTVVAACWDSTTDVYTSVPTGYTSAGGLGSIIGSGGGNGCSLASGYRSSVIDPAAVENPAAFSSSAEQWAAITIALRPAVLEGIQTVTPNEFDMDEASVVLAALNLGATQSTGTIYISDATTLAGSVNEVDVSSAVIAWNDTGITLNLTNLSDAELTSLQTLGPGSRYIIVLTSASDEYASDAITLHRPDAFIMSLSSNFAPSITTQRLTGLTGTFGGGRIEEVLNPSTTDTDVATDGNREDVWNIQAKLGSREVSYDFRVLYGGNVPDTITQTPQVTIGATLGDDLVKILDEVENSSEVKNTSLLLNRLLAEVINSNEDQTTSLLLNRSLSETVNQKEDPGIINTLAINRIIDEVEQANETIILLRARTQIINETLNISETAINLLSVLILQIIDEVINNNEDFNVSLALTRLINEAKNINESIAASLEKVRVLNEIENVNETTLLAQIRVKIISEILNSTEAAITSKEISRILSESLNISEDNLESLAAIIIEVINEAVDLSETQIDILAAVIVEVINEILNNPETIIKTSLLVREITEIVQKSETLEQALVSIRIILEAQNITENVSAARKIIIIINEVIDFVENIIETRVLPLVGALSAMIRLLPSMTGQGNIKPTINAKAEINPALEGKPEVKPKNG